MAGPFFTAFPSLSTALKSGTPIYTKSRACTVLPNFVGLKFMVHNGKDYLPVQIGEEMVGHKLGEFAPTRKMFSYRCVTLSLWLAGVRLGLAPGVARRGMDDRSYAAIPPDWWSRLMMELAGLGVGHALIARQTKNR